MMCKIVFKNARPIEFEYDEERSSMNGSGAISIFDLDEMKVVALHLANPNILYVEYEVP
jgi:hypothetical protein